MIAERDQHCNFGRDGSFASIRICPLSTPKYDLSTHIERSRKGPCFVCAYLGGHPDYVHEPVYTDDEVVAFPSRYPTLLRYTAPIHRWARAIRVALFIIQMGSASTPNCAIKPLRYLSVELIIMGV